HPRSFRDDFLAAHVLPGRAGEAYNRHGMLLPFLFIPGYAFLGRLGLAALLAAAWGLLLARLARALARSGLPERDGRTALVLLTIASPLPLFTVFMGPDLPTALLVTLWLAAALDGRRGAALACVAALPWVHLKGALLGAGLVLGGTILHGVAWGAWSAAALGGSLAGLVGVLHAATPVPAWPPWSVLTYSAGHYNERFDLRNAPRSVLATLFDRHQGLVHFPLLLLALAGIVLLWRSRPRLAACAAASAGPYLLALACYSQWHGGPGAPGRMLVVVLPLLAFPLAAAVGRLRAARAGRALLAGGLGLGLVASWGLAAVPALAFVSAKARLESVAAAKLGVDPLGVLPGFGLDAPPPGTFPRAAVWLVLLALGTAWLARPFDTLGVFRRSSR
ncbi:MAG: hypothetical protein AAB368_05260, partial [bacterium]